MFQLTIKNKLLAQSRNKANKGLSGVRKFVARISYRST